MVNTVVDARPGSFSPVARLIGIYIVIVVATIAVLAVLAAVDPGQAPSEAWWHAVIVGVFAVVLPLRLRAARRGNRHAILAVGVIAAVLVLVNVVEALIPGFLPSWMRIEMIGIAALMAAVSVFVWRLRAVVTSRWEQRTQ